MIRPALLASVALLALAGCGDSPMARGIVITGDGKVGANNARNQRENAQDALRIAIEDDLGKGWSTRVAIEELPEWIEERASEDGYWRWSKLSAVVEITPPVGQQLSEAKRADLEEGARKYLVQKLVKKDPAQLAFSLKVAAAVPAVVTAPVAQAPGQRSYLVQPGDTLADLSTAFYGSAQHWRVIAEANPGGVQPGQTVIIPALPAAPAPAPVPAAP